MTIGECAKEMVKILSSNLSEAEVLEEIAKLKEAINASS